jgi:hypothetical protein
MGKKTELVGKTFNKLTVIRSLGSKIVNGKSRGISWLCLCSCGNEVEISTGSLTSGNTGSCGRCATTLLKKEFVGNVFSTKYHGDFMVTEYVNNAEVYIKFLSTGYVTKTALKEIRKGTIKDPYAPTVCGVGYLGVGVHEAKMENGKSAPAYEVWSGMIKRCYNPVWQQKQGRESYAGCTVDTFWHCYQNFAEWFYNQRMWQHGFHVDKDLRKLGNKVYSEATCSLVPHEVNSFLTGSSCNISPRDLPVGIHFCINKKLYIAQIHRGETTKNGKPKQSYLGQYKTKEDALFAYKTAKEGRSKQLAEKYKDVLHPDVYNTLMTFEVKLLNNKENNNE